MEFLDLLWGGMTLLLANTFVNFVCISTLVCMYVCVRVHKYSCVCVHADTHVIVHLCEHICLSMCDVIVSSLCTGMLPKLKGLRL